MSTLNCREGYLEKNEYLKTKMGTQTWRDGYTYLEREMGTHAWNKMGTHTWNKMGTCTWRKI